MLDLKELTADVVTAHITKSKVSVDQLPTLIKDVYSAFARLGQSANADEGKPSPAEGAVSIRKSLSNPDRIISMIDGKPYASLKRHLGTHGYTPDSYRDAFGLKPDYPMIAPGYAERRKQIAKSIGLGRNGEGNKVQPTDQGEAPSQAAMPTSEEDVTKKKPRKAKKAGASEVSQQQAESSTEQLSGGE